MKIIHRDQGPVTSALGLLEGGLVQPVPLPAIDSVLNRIDEAIDDAIRSNNPDAAFAVGLQLIQINRLSGFGLAKFLWRMQQRISEFKLTEDAYEDIVFDKLGLPADTTKQYVRAWDRIETLPIDSKTRNLLLEKGIKSMIAIVKAESKLVKLGKPKFTEAQLQKIAKTTDHSGVIQTLNELKGQKAKKPATYYKLRRDGTLEYWNKGKRLNIGVLFVDNADAQEPIQHLLDNIGALIE